MIQTTPSGALPDASFQTLDEGTAGKWIQCPHCEAPCRERALRAGQELKCTRCGVTVLEYVGKRTLQPAMALSMTGLFILLLANVSPILTFEVVGRMQSGFMITGVIELSQQGYLPIAILVFFCGILAPALYLAAVCYVSTACALGLRLPMLRFVYEAVHLLEPWNLIPVFAIAALVASVKLKMLGTVEWQIGARWVLGVSVMTLFCEQVFDRRLVEERLNSMKI